MYCAVFIRCTTALTCCHSCHSLSLFVTHFHSLPLVVPLVVTRCQSLSLVVLLVVTRCHSLSLVLPLAVTHCHSLSLAVPLVVIRCHSLYHSLLPVAIRCHSLYNSLSFVVTRCTIRLSFYKRSWKYYRNLHQMIKLIIKLQIFRCFDPSCNFEIYCFDQKRLFN